MILDRRIARVNLFLSRPPEKSPLLNQALPLKKLSNKENKKSNKWKTL